MLPVTLDRRIFWSGIELVWSTEAAYPQDSRPALLNGDKATTGDRDCNIEPPTSPYQRMPIMNCRDALKFGAATLWELASES